MGETLRVQVDDESVESAAIREFSSQTRHKPSDSNRTASEASVPPSKMGSDLE